MQLRRQTSSCCEDQVAQVQKNSIISNGAIDAALRDLILTFRKDLRDDNTMSATGIECEVIVAGVADWPAITRICLENFSGYPGHYQLSPYLADATAAQGMLSWLHLLQQQDNEAVYIVRQGETIMGVLGYSYEKQIAELAIAAISAEAGIRQRNLLLVEATRRVEKRLMRRGMKRFLAKTQATNLSIQRISYDMCIASLLQLWQLRMFTFFLASSPKMVRISHVSKICTRR
jgi:hypothetical protein